MKTTNLIAMQLYFLFSKENLEIFICNKNIIQWQWSKMFFKKVYIQLVVDFWYIFQELINLHLMPNYSEITSVSWFSDNQQMGMELKAAHHKITKSNCIL